MDPNNTMNSSLSVWASSLIIDSLSTDANLLLSGGPQSWRSASTNMESYLSLPSSPMSFSSYNLSISGSSGIDGSSAMEQTSPLDKNCRQVWKRQQQQQQQLGVVNATSQPPSQTHYLSLLTGIKQEPDNSTQMPKKPRLEVQEEDFLHQQIIQQLLQRKDSLQLQGHNPHLQAWIQQHKMRNQQHQKILQSIQQLQGVDMQQQQQQMRNQLQQQSTHEVSAMRPSDSGICSRRLMQYMYHQRHRPPVSCWFNQHSLQMMVMISWLLLLLLSLFVIFKWWFLLFPWLFICGDFLASEVYFYSSCFCFCFSSLFLDLSLDMV